jgi:hypothetical protein
MIEHDNRIIGREISRGLTLLASMLATLIVVVWIYPILAQSYLLPLIALVILVTWLGVFTYRFLKLP